MKGILQLIRKVVSSNCCFHRESSFKFKASKKAHAGQRICLDREFAYWQMNIFAFILLSCFCFKLMKIFGSIY
ncbi:putative abieta-7,13-dien-18-ol hydroxylase [Helianthus annuus]|nr:putative abieta-7,13-dien-18-ol hydroxylase [Helianthus annuus]